MSEQTKGRAVLVTTEHRGVFFGYLVSGTVPSKEKVQITDMRNCVSWSQEMHGVFGLAAFGPSKSCRIGPKVPDETTLWDITSCVTVSADAVARWESSQWA